MVDRRLRWLVPALTCLGLAACRSRSSAPPDSGSKVATAKATAAAASAQPPAKSGPVVLAQDARAFVVNGGVRYAAFNSPSGSETWRIDTFSATGEPTTLGTQSRFGDHAALSVDKDGALLALTLLDDSSGGVYRFAPGGKVTALFEGEPFHAKLTSVVGAEDYVFAASPLVRFHKPSGKAKSLGVRDVVQLAASEGTLFIAEQTTTEKGQTRWSIRSMPYATASFSPIATGEGIVYGLAASGEGIAWSTLDTPTVDAAESATGSVWFRRRKSDAPSRLARDLPSPMGVVLDASHVYVALRGGRGEGVANGGIVRLPLGGGAPEVVAADVGSPILVSVDDAHVYTLAESRVQTSAPYFGALTFLSSAGDVLSFEKPRSRP